MKTAKEHVTVRLDADNLDALRGMFPQLSKGIDFAIAQYLRRCLSPDIVEQARAKGVARKSSKS